MLSEMLPKLTQGLTKDDFATLGEIAVSMSSLEYMVQMVVWNILKLESEIGIIITGPMQLNQKMEMLAALTVKLPSGSAELKEIIKKIEAVRPERNRKLHAFWIHNQTQEKVALTLGSDRRSMKITNVSSEELIQAMTDIKEAENQLVQWFLAYQYHA